MPADLQHILKEAQSQISNAQDLKSLDTIRIQYLGKKGQLTEQLKQLGKLSPEERPKVGQAVNEVKQQVQTLLDEKLKSIQNKILEQKLNAETLDITLPGRGMSLGTLHPVTQMRLHLERLFRSMGFEVVEGPEIEDDYHNFTALNIPDHHPAREMHDTFYCDNGYLLRTHTSPVQIRVMESQKPPLRIVTPGRVFRCDSDQSHTPMFHQIEGLLIDDHSTFADLKGLIQDFLRTLFGDESLKLRFRASYFPFTEPSAEVDIACTVCGGKGCRTCGQTGWMEVLGCGMVHPNVLENVGIDNEKYAGFAFGVGIDRLALLRYAIPDLRLFFENDLRFLAQF